MTDSAEGPALLAAEKLFREKGYVGTSPDEIAAAARARGAGADTVIDKQALLWAIATRAADEFFAALEPVASSEEATPVKLRKAIIAHVGVITRNLDASAVYFSEWRHLPEPQRAEYTRRRDDYEACFRGVLSQGIHEGIFAPVDERFAARLVLSALNWTHQWYRPDGPMTPDEIGSTLADMLLNGLYRTA